MLPDELKPKQSDFKRWQMQARIKALTVIVKFLVIVVLCLGSFCLGRYF